MISKSTYKKKEGEIRIQHDTITWTVQGGKSPDLRIQMDQVKVQQVNVPGPTGKILLKLTLLSEQSHSFSFAKLEDRERIKDAIALELGRLQKRQVNNSSSASRSRAGTPTAPTHETTDALTLQDIQIRQSLLTKNKDLAHLHKKLVMSGLISENEFWDSRKHVLETERWNLNQKSGPSSASLADIKPDQDTSGSDLKYTLTPEIIHSIFAQYPAVLKAYQDHVPHNLTEKEFWTKYFTSKHFHRNRVGLDKDKDDFFEKYMQEEQNDYLLSPEGLTFEGKNKLLDLLRTTEDHTDHGNAPDSTMKAGSVREALPLLRKFNRHSQLILKQTTSASKRNEATQQSSSAILDSETRIPDLQAQESEKVSRLNISDPSNYFDVQGSIESEERPAKRIRKDVSQIPDDWDIHLSKLQYRGLISNTVFETLSSLTQRRKQDDDIFAAGRVSKNRVFPEVVELQASANELSRHFWANFNTYQLTQHQDVKIKLEKIRDALKQMVVKMNALEVQVGTVNDQKLCKSLLITTRSGVNKALSMQIN